MDKEEIERLKKHYVVSDEQLNAAADIIYNRMIFNKTPVKYPIAVVVGGQPGAGKSGLIDKTLAEMENSVILDVDDFRYFHPKAEEIVTKYPSDLATFTVDFVNRIFANVIKRLEEAKYNLIMQKTLRDDEVIYDTLVALKDAGYLVVTRALAVSDLESKLSTLERSLAVKNTVGYCRWTPLKNQDYAIKNMPETTKHIFDSKYCDVVQVFRRDTIPCNSVLVYSKSKESSKKDIERCKKCVSNISLDDFGQDKYTDEVDAIILNRQKDAVLHICDIMTRIVLAKQHMDEDGLVYLEEMEKIASNYFLKTNDLKGVYMDNNIKLELAKEIMARMIASRCKNGFNPNDKKLLSLLDEEEKMNKFDAATIEKIINDYGKKIKSGEI